MKPAGSKKSDVGNNSILAKIAAPLAMVVWAFLLVTPAIADSHRCTPQEQTGWLRWLIPMPKEIAIESAVDVPPGAVHVVVAGPSSDSIGTAADELREALGGKAAAGTAQFTILLGVCDAAGRLGNVSVPDAARLATLPNAEQAYLIRPLGENRLVLASHDLRGVYYAAQTLRQLLERTHEGPRISIPLLSVTDWPDLAERGLWGGSAEHDIVWMAHHKMNLIESHSKLTMTADAHGQATANAQQIDLAQRHALKFVPIITHLNGLAQTGLYTAYPQLRGQGARAAHATHKELVAPCCSEPRFTEVLADWMVALASQRGVTEICVWLSELERQACQCPRCLAAGTSQYALEARCLVNAYRMAQKQQPDFKLRILLTQGSYDTNDKVLAEVPSDVRVIYYDGGRTYDSSRNPMIYPLLEQYVARGGWLGCYPQLTASWRIVCPWSGPQFIRCRMNEFVDKKLQCVCGYATPDSRLYEFNILAAAEWSWNAKGRDEREFAAAWAQRRGLPVDDAAQWAVSLGPVGWDVYGSGVPSPEFLGRASMLIARRWKLEFGKGLLRYFPSPEHIDTDRAVCRKALAIARRLNDPLLISETQTIDTYLRMIGAIATIARLTSEAKIPTYDRRVEIQRALGDLCITSSENVEALQEWEHTCREPAAVDLGGARFADTIEASEKTTAEIARALEKIGIANPLGSYLREEIGRWATEDFDAQAAVTKSFEVTRCMTTAGAYQVGFVYTSGWNGLSINRVSLVTTSHDKPENRTSLSVDAHHGSAAAQNRANIYSVRLERHDPTARYSIVAEIRGTPNKGRPIERQGCNGSVWIKGQRPDDWRSRIEMARPLTDEQLKQRK
jgi:hypothetical protein